MAEEDVPGGVVASDGDGEREASGGEGEWIVPDEAELSESVQSKPEPLKLVPGVDVPPVLTRKAYVEREVEITRQRFAHDPDLKGRLKRSRDYCEWRWEQYHTTLSGERLEDGDFKHDFRDRQVSSL